MANLVSSDFGALKLYIHSGTTSTISSSFAGPGTGTRDLTTDASGNLISGDSGTDNIYVHSGITSTISSSFDTPSTDPHGLTYDSAGGC